MDISAPACVFQGCWSEIAFPAPPCFLEQPVNKLVVVRSIAVERIGIDSDWTLARIERASIHASEGSGGPKLFAASTSRKRPHEKQK
jgi:hypothetical protein